MVELDPVRRPPAYHVDVDVGLEETQHWVGCHCQLTAVEVTRHVRVVVE